MKTSPLLAALSAAVLLSFHPAGAQAAGSDKDALIKLEHEWSNAYVSRDLSVFERIEADDFTITDTDGKLSTKKEDLKIFAAGPIFTSMKASKLKVRVYGDAAVIDGIALVKGHVKEKDISGAFAFTDVFVKQSGQWKAVSTHLSKVEKQ